jgi:hypothetical protein
MYAADHENHVLECCADILQWTIIAECPGGASVDCGGGWYNVHCVDETGNEKRWEDLGNCAGSTGDGGGGS